MRFAVCCCRTCGLKFVVALRKRWARLRMSRHFHLCGRPFKTGSQASAPKPPGPSPKSKANSLQIISSVKEASRMSISKCVLLLIVLSVSASAQQKAGTLKIKPYTFENGQKEKVDAEFGTLLVPENRSNPQSNLIELAF